MPPAEISITAFLQSGGISVGMKTRLNELEVKRQPTPRRFLLICLLFLGSVIVWAGCKEETKVAAEINPVGTYTLVSVDGKNVPCSLTHEGHSLTVKSGTFIINADGTCSCTTGFSTSAGHDVNREVRATYTRKGAKLTMKWKGAGVTTGTIEGDTFTMNNEGMLFSYRK